MSLTPDDGEGVEMDVVSVRMVVGGTQLDPRYTYAQDGG